MFQCKFTSLEERKLDVRKSNYYEKYIDFEFPPQNFQKIIFTDIRDLNDAIVRMGLKIGFYRGRVYNRKDHERLKGKKMVYICKHKQCSSRLVYVWMEHEPEIKCELFDNVHIHRKSSNLETLKRQYAQQFIMDMPESENWENYQKWMYRFDIPDKDARYIVEQLFWYNNTEDQIFTRLAFERKTIRRIKDEDDNTIIIFLSNQTMKKNYEIYGDAITFDMTYRMLKKKNPFGNYYGVGYFFGQDTNNRLVLFAICLLAKDEKNYFKTVFQYFFDLISRNHLPKAIITDDFNLITQAISEVKKERNYDIVHLFDWFHVTENLRYSLREQVNGEEVFYLFCKALGEPNIYNYNKIIKEIQRKLKTCEILEDFVQKQKYYCISKLPPTFIGLGILFKSGRHVNGRLNSCIVYDTYGGRFFFNVFQRQKILQKMIDKVTVINASFTRNISFEEIHKLTERIETEIMHKLINYFKDSTENLFLQKTTHCDYKVIRKNCQQEVIECFALRYDLSRQRWVCSCKLQFMIGLPCAHIIKILREKDINGSLEYYINERWIHDKQDKIPEVSKPYISRKKRRA